MHKKSLSRNSILGHTFSCDSDHCSSPNPCDSFLFQSHLTVLYVPTLGTLLLTRSHSCPIFGMDFGIALPFKALLEHVVLKVGGLVLG